MGRHPRIHQPQLLFHVMARGNNGQEIFNSPKDYGSFLEMMRETKKHYRFKLYAYALMPNHIHLLLEVGEQPSARIMQSLLTGYARYFNRTYKRRGHLFQGRYKAILCEKDAYAMWLVRYIHLNPVRAHISADVDQWKWSGHGEYCGRTGQSLIDPGVVTELFGVGEKGLANYRDFMSDNLIQAHKYDEDLHPTEASPFLGSQRFIEEIAYKVEPPEKIKLRKIKDIINDQLKGTKISSEMVLGKSRKKDIADIRKQVIRSAMLEHGYRASELARQLNCSEPYISRIVS